MSYRTKEDTKGALGKFGYKSEDFEDLSKTELDELLELAQQTSDTKDDGAEMQLWDDIMESNEVEIVADDTDTEQSQKTVEELMTKPSRTDFEWHDYIMQQFHDEELMNGCPKVDGLRRLVEKFIGQIITTNVKIVQTPCPENRERASVIYSATIIDKDSSYQQTLTYTDAADCYKGNALNEYSKHPVALATTRAEARVLRKVLKLRTIAAEEQTSDIVNVIDKDNTDKITQEQIKTIMVLAERTGIDINALLKHNEKEEISSLGNILNATQVTGKSILKILSVYQGEPELIPDIIKEKA